MKKFVEVNVWMCLLIGCLITSNIFAMEKKDFALEPESMDIARRAFVQVQVHVKKAERPEDVELQPYETDIRDLDSLISDQRTHDRSGLILNDNGDVLITELRMDEANLDRIEIIDCQGNTLEAEIKSLYLNAPAMILSVKGDLPDSVKAPVFHKTAPVADNYFFEVFLNHEAENWKLREMQSSSHAVDYNSRDKDPYIYRPMYLSDFRLLYDKKRKVVGVSMMPRMDDRETGGIWKGESWLNGETISWEEYSQFREELTGAYDSVIHEVTIEFRKKADKDTGLGGFFGRMISAAEDQAESKMKELKAYGPAVGEKMIFLPVTIPRERAKLIDIITVKIGDQKRKARFLGAFKDFEGTLLELEEGNFPRVADLGAASTIERIKPFYVIRAQDKLGGKFMTCHFNRWIEKKKGYKNKYYWKPIYSLRKGDVILDDKGRMAGLWLNLRKEGEDMRKAAQSESYSMFGKEYFESDWEWSGGYGNTVFYSAEKLKEILEDPKSFFDPTIQARSKDDERTKLWLGVELDPMNKELSKSLNVETLTMDGSIGILVSTVYENSPADEIGIKPGDILLRIKPEIGSLESLDLRYNRKDLDLDFDEGDVPPQLQSMGFKMPEKAPWRSRDNYLTKLLETIGEGRKITLTYISEGQEIKADLIIEKAPMDYDSAEKYKDKQLGLTVRNVTYEVHKALSMTTEDPGVVIAKIEEAEPAALARLKQYEIITKVDGEAIQNVEQFEKAVRKARDEGRSTIQLQVQNLGKTRFADLKIE